MNQFQSSYRHLNIIIEILITLFCNLSPNGGFPVITFLTLLLVEIIVVYCPPNNNRCNKHNNKLFHSETQLDKCPTMQCQCKVIRHRVILLSLHSVVTPVVIPRCFLLHGLYHHPAWCQHLLRHSQVTSLGLLVISWTEM